MATLHATSLHSYAPFSFAIVFLSVSEVPAQIELDKKLIRRALMNNDETALALRKSVTYEMAEQRLAAKDWFWSEAKQDFVRVTE